jgi:hypothetical protein
LRILYFIPFAEQALKFFVPLCVPQEFLLDLLDLENPDVNRDAKLLVVERMWRCWSVRLGWSNKSPN